MRPTHAVLLIALTLPVAAAEAQQQPSGPPTDPIMTSFRNRTGALRRNLAQAFDSIPATLFGYKPTPAQLTIGYVAQHLAADNYFFCNNLSDKKATVAAEDTSTPDSVRATWSKETLVAKLKAANAFCDEVMTGMNDSKVAELVTVTAQNGQTRQVPRINYLVGHAIDLADHYSQIANYMRINNMLPPTALPRPRP